MTDLRRERTQMHKAVGFLWTVGFFGLLATADAQTPSPPTASTEFDGTYAFASATTLNETYMTTWRTRMGRCGDIRKMGPLTIAAGQARYSGFGRTTKEGFEGTVGPRGEVTMKLSAPASHSPLGVEIISRGTIDGNGTVRLRQMGRSCSYDLVWQKETR